MVLYAFQGIECLKSWQNLSTLLKWPVRKRYDLAEICDLLKFKTIPPLCFSVSFLVLGKFTKMLHLGDGYRPMVRKRFLYILP